MEQGLPRNAGSERVALLVPGPGATQREAHCRSPACGSWWPPTLAAR